MIQAKWLAIVVITAIVNRAESAAIYKERTEIGDTNWWKTGIYYQIYPRSFKDSNNDGIGDLQGIISKLEHLKDAGITTAWLSPIYKSPQVDQGYDISDFKSIHEEYGTMDDFHHLVARAKELGLRVIMDFVPNHSSNEHEWFKKSENLEPGYEDYYVWHDGNSTGGPPNNWLSLFRYSAWEYSNIRKQYYLHQFAIPQADLNYNSPALAREMKEVMRFWLDKGIDGFRMDAVPYLFEDQRLLDEPPSGAANASDDHHDSLLHIYTKDQIATFNLIYEWRQFIDEYNTQHGGDLRVLITEAYTTLDNTMLYYGNGSNNGAHFTFNFFLLTNLTNSSTAHDVVTVVETWMAKMPEGCVANWVLGNHDNFRFATRFGPKNVDGFHMLAALLPGIMVTYNGEEIGQENGEVSWEQMQDPIACNGDRRDFNLTSRDFARTPFHWDDTINAGFNEGARPWLPVSEKYLETNLAAQSAYGVRSHYKVYQELLQLRKIPAFINGNLEIRAASNKTVMFVRNLVTSSDTYIIVFNIANEPDEVDVRFLSPYLGSFLKVVVLSVDSDHQKGDIVPSNSLILDGHEALVLVTTIDDVLIVGGGPNNKIF